MERLNPLTTLLFALSLVLLVFIVPSPLFAAGIFLFVLIPASLFLKSFKKMAGVIIRFILPFSIFLFAVHCFLIPSDNVVIIKGISINFDGLLNAFLITSRVIVLVGSITLLFRTTSPVRITRELTLRKMPMGPLYVINTTLQILPRMKKRAEIIQEAQRARGLDTSGNIIKRSKALIPLLGPLFFGLLKEVEQRALIIEINSFSESNREVFSLNSRDERWQRVVRIIMILLVCTALGIRIWML